MKVLTRGLRLKPPLTTCRRCPVLSPTSAHSSICHSFNIIMLYMDSKLLDASQMTHVLAHRIRSDDDAVTDAVRESEVVAVARA